MMELASRWPAVLVLASMAGMACAQSDTPWSGGHAGLNLGEASTSACNTWTAGGTAVNPAGGPAFYSSNCASSSFVGGVQVGDNFQYKRLVWGIEADLDLWEGGNRSQTLKYAGETPPAGTYNSSGKLTPSDFVIIAPRIGYGGTLWMPYFPPGAIPLLDCPASTLATHAPVPATPA